MPDDTDGLPNAGPTLNADGTMEGRAAPSPAPEPRPPEPEAPLELAERPPPPPPAPDPAPPAEPPDAPRARPPRPWVGPVVALAFVVMALGSGWSALRDRRVLMDGVKPLTRLEELATTGQGHHTLLVTSTPSGATVLLNGREVGVTPFAGDNDAAGEVTVELRLPGYRPTVLRAAGRTEARLEAQLVRP